MRPSCYTLRMGQWQIIDKLKEEIMHLEHQEFSLGEKEVVYFLVEARKVLEHENSANIFRAIKFYADWAVHTRKDRGVPPFIQDMIGKGSIDKFVSMEYLRKELSKFLDAHGLPLFFVEEKNWKLFWTKLINVLSEQPLFLKIAITRFQFHATGNTVNYEYDEIA
jgi:hypothetical protein